MLAPRLEKGDTIGLFSPSAPISATVPVRYERGREYLEEKGFRIKEGMLTGKRDSYRSGSIKERAEELNALIRDDEVKCIMSTIGGMNSNSLLPYIDYEALKRKPKIIVGYSDVTALLLGIYAKTGITTYYGPAAAASFGELPPLVDETFSYFMDIVSGKNSAPYKLKTPGHWTDERLDWAHQERAKNLYPNELVTARPGKARGRLIGGNLNTMLGIFGSPYMPRIKDGDILYIEDSLKDAADQERSFALLENSGAFDRISGLVLGKHELYDDLGSGRRPYEILLEVSARHSFPILAEFDSSHAHPMLTLPIGIEAELDADKKTLTLDEPFIG